MAMDMSKWPWIYQNHNLVLSSFMIYHWICNRSNMKGVTSGAGIAYSFRAVEFTSVFKGIHVAQLSVLEQLSSPLFLKGFMLLNCQF